MNLFTMITKRISQFLFIPVTILLLSAGLTNQLAAQQDNLKLVKRYGDWGLYLYDDPKEKMCFIMSYPKKSRPETVKRGDIVFYVTSFAGQGVKNEVSVMVGYPLKKDSQPKVSIDGKSYKMFVEGERAYVDNADDQADLVRAMRKGRKLSVTGTSARGTTTTDEYSLKGVTASLRHLRRLCK